MGKYKSHLSGIGTFTLRAIVVALVKQSTSRLSQSSPLQREKLSKAVYLERQERQRVVQGYNDSKETSN